MPFEVAMLGGKPVKMWLSFLVGLALLGCATPRLQIQANNSPSVKAVKVSGRILSGALTLGGSEAAYACARGGESISSCNGKIARIYSLLLLGAAQGAGAGLSAAGQSYRATPSPVVAGCERSFDASSGNSYTTCPQAAGGYVINGYNSRTGTTWRAVMDSKGNMRGTDGDGNYWTYDSYTGVYHNFGTGISCYGKGTLRTCH